MSDTTPVIGDNEEPCPDRSPHGQHVYDHGDPWGEIRCPGSPFSVASDTTRDPDGLESALDDLLADLGGDRTVDDQWPIYVAEGSCAQTAAALASRLLAAGWRRDGEPETQYAVGEEILALFADRDDADDFAISNGPVLARQVVPLGPWVLVDNQPVCSCGGRRWVADQGWQPDHPWDGTRSEGAGLIPCGFCNHGGWNTPLVEPVRAAGHETGDQT